jgi:hypothetical protein
MVGERSIDVTDWQQYAKEHDIHPVDVNIFVTENDFCPNCGGKFGDFLEGESAIPHFAGVCKHGD